MSKFTKEQLVQYIKVCIEHTEQFPGLEIADKEKAIFEIALEALTAESMDGEARQHIKKEEDALVDRRRRNRESNARARERETPAQRKARLAKNRARMAIRRKGGAK